MVTPYWFPVRGGVTTYVSGLAEELRAQGHEVHVVARTGNAPGAEELGGTGTEFARRAARALDRIRPDAIHAHGHWYTLAAGLRHRRRHPQCRVTFTLHTPFPRRSWWRRAGFRSLMSRADFVTAVSADLLAASLQAFRPRTRTRVTGPGVAVRPLDPADGQRFRQEFGLAGRGPLVGYLGRLAWEGKVRGVADLIRAMRLVRERIPTAILVVAGDGPHRRALEDLATQGAPGGVVFLGDVPDPAPRFYEAIDLYAHISYQEGLPIALLEAMACGKPVIASPVGGVPEVIRDGVNGYLVSGGPPDVAARVVELLTSPALAKPIVERAQEDAAQRFAWPSSAARFLPLYGVPSRHRVAVTVDLERDYFAPEGSVRGVQEGMPKLLDLFDRHGIRSTVFATSDLCDRFGELLRGIVRRGHALGCHGASHDVEYLSSRPFDWQIESLRRATDALERTVGVRPTGFRAPNFSADGSTVRALEGLGYAYDSSVLPGRVVKAKRLWTILDFLVAPRDPYRPSGGDPGLPGLSPIWEFPVAENPRSPGGPIGLGYVNASGPEKALDAVARSAADPCVLLIHPWELVDPPAGDIPDWMRTGCTSDPSKLDAFLAGLRRDHELTTLEAELARVTGRGTPAPRA